MAYFRHERLDVYQLALAVARQVGAARFPRGEADLRDQAVRASRSVVLNIAEGCSRGGAAGRNHFRIAAGSAAETCAALDLTTLPDMEPVQADLRRVGAMLAGLAR